MNVKRLVIAAVAVWVFYFVFGFVFHGILLRGQYAAMGPEMVRPDDELLMHWIVLGHLVSAFFFCLIFTKGYENRGIGEGIRYGLLIGLLVFVPYNLVAYALQPYPGLLILWFIVGGIVQSVLAGMIAAGIYRPARAG